MKIYCKYDKLENPKKLKNHPKNRNKHGQDQIKKNEIFMEPFGGSGVGIIAAEKCGVKCYCMEFEPIYVDVIIKRWENFTGQKAELLNG